MSELFITATKKSGRPRVNYTRGPVTKSEYKFVHKFVDAMVRDKQRFSVIELQGLLHSTTGNIRKTSTIIRMVNDALATPNIGYKPSWFKRQATKVYNLIR